MERMEDKILADAGPIDIDLVSAIQYIRRQSPVQFKAIRDFINRKKEDAEMRLDREVEGYLIYRNQGVKAEMKHILLLFDNADMLADALKKTEEPPEEGPNENAFN